jgi:cadmium resistance protein CadD (predicted permease)
MTIIFLVAGTYIATNVDNLLLLVGWMLGRHGSTGRILAGYWIATIAILLASWALGLSANVIPIHYVGYLGLAPIMLGVRALIRQFRGREDAPAGPIPEKFSVLAITTTLFANSADTMLVFSPLLADSETGTDYMIVVGYVATATIWFLLALFFSRHAARLQPVSVAARWLAPLIMIVIGFYILNNTLTDVVPGS